MDEFFKKIDWRMLRDHKLVLIGVIHGIEYRDEGNPDGSPDADALTGILHLIDYVQDEADKRGLVPADAWLTEDDE